jgi:hypothetical protein
MCYTEDMKTNQENHMFDAETGEDLGVATLRQIEVSYASVPEGFFLIDQDGDPVGSAFSPARKVYVEKV